MFHKGNRAGKMCKSCARNFPHLGGTAVRKANRNRTSRRSPALSLTRFRLLQFADALRQFGQTRQPAILFLESGERSCRRAPNRLTATNDLPARDSSLGADDCVVFQRAVRRDTHLAAYQDLRADRATAGNTYLRGYNRIASDAHVVSDLDQVINLDALSNLGRRERPTVNRCIAANFHVVTDFHAADLRELDVLTVTEDIAEAVAADHRAAVDFHAISELCPGVERYPRMQPAVFSHPSAATQKTECLHVCSCADFRFVFDYNVRAHANVGSQPRCRGDDCGGMNFRTQRRCGKQPRCRLREGEFRVLDFQDCLAGQIRAWGSEHATRRRARSELQLARRVSVDQMLRLRALRTGDAADRDLRVSVDFGT